MLVRPVAPAQASEFFFHEAFFIFFAVKATDLAALGHVTPPEIHILLWVRVGCVCWCVLCLVNMDTHM